MHSFWAKYFYILGSETFTGWVVGLGAGISKHEGREQDVLASSPPLECKKVQINSIIAGRF